MQAAVAWKGRSRARRGGLAEYRRCEIARQNGDRRKDNDRDDEQGGEPESEPLQYCLEDWIHAATLVSRTDARHPRRTSTAQLRLSPRQCNARNGPPLPRRPQPPPNHPPTHHPLPTFLPSPSHSPP